MKTAVTAVLFAAVSLSGIPSSRADTAMSYTGMLSKEPLTVFTAGAKQRREMTMPFIGRQVIITRADKGVEWTLNPKNKTYTEAPLALPYSSSRRDSDARDRGNGRGDDDGGDTCTPATIKLPTARTVAGLKAAGHRFGCKESPGEGMIVWLAEENAVTRKAQADLKAFGAAHAKAQFAKYPPKERATMEKGLSLWANLIGDLPALMGGERLPDALMLAMETESPESGRQIFYEISSLKTGAIPANRFEIPPGYKKASPGASPFGALGNIDFGDMMKEMKNLAPQGD